MNTLNTVPMTDSNSALESVLYKKRRAQNGEQASLLDHFDWKSLSELSAALRERNYSRAEAQSLQRVLNDVSKIPA